MTKLEWNQTGTRYFEVGVDRGVLFIADGSGIAWNGLTSVKESPSGGGATPYYIDGVKYLNLATAKEFQGRIEAYTYPDEFSEYDGWNAQDNGLSIDQQLNKPFSMSYRSLIGNDIDEESHGYKIHLVYNTLTEPTDIDYESISEEIDPIIFSWGFTTLPVVLDNLHPTSHIVVDSTKTNPTQLRFIEEYIYGTDTQSSTLPTIEQMIEWFANPMVTLTIGQNPATGISETTESTTLIGDLQGRTNEGIYTMPPGSALIETATPGLYLLEN